MGKAILITPAYLSLAWTLMITYQMFTETAVNTLMGIILVTWPQVGQVLSGRVEMIVFIYAFSWIFLLSSVIPSLLLGKERGVISQFVIVLVLTVVSLVVQDFLLIYMGFRVDQLFNLVTYLENPYLAFVFLSAPYLLMLSIDLRGRMRKKEQLSREKRLMDIIYLQNRKMEELTQPQPGSRRRRSE